MAVGVQVTAIRKPTVSPFNNLALVEVYESEAGHGFARIPEANELTNHLGIVHGGALFTLGDVAAGHAVYGMLPKIGVKVRAIARNAQIAFLKMARGAISADARVTVPLDEISETLLNNPSMDLEVEVKFTNDSSDLVATMNAIWYLKRKAPPEESARMSQ